VGVLASMPFVCVVLWGFEGGFFGGEMGYGLFGGRWLV